MKQYFICETCGKKYDSDKEALACEAYHVEENERVERLKKEKNDRRAAIRKMVEEYEKDYNEIYIGSSFSKSDSLENLLNELFGVGRKSHLG